MTYCSQALLVPGERTDKVGPETKPLARPSSRHERARALLAAEVDGLRAAKTDLCEDRLTASRDRDQKARAFAFEAESNEANCDLATAGTARCEVRSGSWSC